MRDDARRYARRVMLSSSDVFLRGRGSQLGMLQWALAQKRGRKAPRRSRSAMDGYECNLLLICRGRDEVVFLFLGRLKSRAERVLVWLHRSRKGQLPAIRLRPNAVSPPQRSAARGEKIGMERRLRTDGQTVTVGRRGRTSSAAVTQEE